MRRIRPLARAIPVLLTATLAGTACQPAPPPGVADGHLFIVGGGSRPDSLMSRFVELAGGPGARIVVFPMASGSPEETGEGQAAGLRELGADARSVVLTRDEAMAASDLSYLDEAGGIWFSGGSQSRLTDVLNGTPVLDAIRRRYREGAVVGGTSAGAAIMSDSMITGSQVDPEADTIGYFGDTFERVARGMMELAPGFGLLPGAMVDQHFLRRERFNRLLAAVLTRPGLIGVGIDESTAIIVRPDGTWEVAGESSALVVDAREAGVSQTGELAASDVRLHLLHAGAVFDPATGAVATP